MPKIVAFVLACVPFGLKAQSNLQPPSVTAIGTSSVVVQADQVTIDLSVVTQSGKAKDAAGRNADRVATLRAALMNILDPGSEVKTVGYSMTQIASGYSVRSTMEVTSTPSAAGGIIDAAAVAGAASVGNVRFTLKSPDQAHQRALEAAVVQAKSHADAMARGLGRSVGIIRSIQEEGTRGASQSSASAFQRSAKGATFVATSVESGPIEVQVSVVIEAQLN
jgi:uncharacterized protein YggE